MWAVYLKRPLSEVNLIVTYQLDSTHPTLLRSSGQLTYNTIIFGQKEQQGSSQEPFFYKLQDNEKMFICFINILILHTEIKERLKCVDGLQQTWRGGVSGSAVINNV